MPSGSVSGACSSVVNHAAVHYTAITYTILHYTILHYTILQLPTPYCTTLYYTTLYCTALHCSSLHYTAAQFSTVQYQSTPCYCDIELSSKLYFTTLLHCSNKVRLDMVTFFTIVTLFGHKAYYEGFTAHSRLQ